MASTNRAIDRLDEQKRHELDNLVTSWQMERMPLSDAEIEVLALYLLGEIDADERRRRLDALFAMTQFENLVRLLLARSNRRLQDQQAGQPIDRQRDKGPQR